MTSRSTTRPTPRNGIVTSPVAAQDPKGIPAFEQKLWLVGGAYDFSLAKVFATYDQAKHNIDLRDKTGTLGLSIPTGGAGKILAAAAPRPAAPARLRRTSPHHLLAGLRLQPVQAHRPVPFLLNDKVTSYDNASSFAAGMRHRF